MSIVEPLAQALQTAWMKLVLRSSVSEGEEAQAVLAVQGERVALWRALTPEDAPLTPLAWTGDGPMWVAPAGEHAAVIVTDDDESSLYNFYAWIAFANGLGLPIGERQPCYTLVGAQSWCADTLAGLQQVQE